jgi:hypothetical protein
MNRLSFYLMVSALILSFADNSNAQKTSTIDKRVYGFGIGLGLGSMSVGDITNSDFGLTLNGRIGNHFLLMAECNPLPVKSPVINESFIAFNIFLAPSFGRTFRLQPGLGVQFRTWSGSDQVENSDIGPILSMDAGYEFKKYEKYSLVIEFVYRNSLIEVEGSVESKFIGLQIVVLRKR